MTVSVRVPLAALLAASVAFTAAPAAARPDGDLGRELRDPRTQQAMGDLLGALFGAVLNMKAEPLARAMDAAGDREGARRIPRGATIGDLAGPEARALPREIRRRAPALVGALGELAGALEEMAPEFEKIGRDFERSVENRD